MRNRRSVILDRGIAIASGPILTFSIYLVFAGHNRPGGGFAGGLVAGVLVALLAAGGGLDAVKRLIPIRSTALLGLGLSLAAATGFGSMIGGGAFLESGYVEFEVPLVGTVKAVSATLFDIGVYLTVVGMSLSLIRSMGEVNQGDTP